jgi:hypothetical protein
MAEENVVPPALMLRQLAFVMRASRALYAAAELNIADFLASGPLTTAELAAAVAADAATLRRLMRALVAHGVFEEETGDRFRLNAAGELMRRDVPGSQRAAVLFTAGNTQWQLWSDFLDCVRACPGRRFSSATRKIQKRPSSLVRRWRHSALPFRRR